LSFAFALGKNTILFPFLYKNVPTFDLFQAPTRITIWAEISFAILAGIGIDNLRPPAGKRQYITRLAAAGCFSISAGALLTNIFLPEIQATFISSIGKVGLLGLVIALSILFMPGKEHVEKSITWQWVIVFIVGIDLIVAGWKLNPGINIDYYQMNQNSSKQSRLFMPDDLEYDLKYNTFFKFGSFFPEEDWTKMKSYLLPNLNMLARIEMVNNFDPILPSRYVTWIDRLNKEGYRNNQQLLRLMNVGKILASSGKDGELDYQLTEMDIHQIFLYPCALAMNEENKILDLLFSGNLENNTVIIEEGQGQVAKLCSGNIGVFSIIQQSPLSIEINVDLERDGWILWSQTWYPGWKGKIDGMPVPVEKANYLFQAIYATSGQHTIEFHYQPESFMWGKIVTALSIFIFLTGIVISRRKSPEIN
jgi:hypothetical protein